MRNLRLVGGRLAGGDEVVDEADLEKRMLALRLLLDWKPR